VLALSLAGLGLLAGIVAQAQSPRAGRSAGAWQEVFAGGFIAYGASGAGGSIEIGCDNAVTLDHSATRISIDMAGGVLPPNAPLRFVVDGQAVSVVSDRAGGLGTGDCVECILAFRQLWPMLRGGSRLEVIAADGRRATFPLDGTSALLPVEPCATQAVATGLPIAIAPAPPVGAVFRRFRALTWAGDELRCGGALISIVGAGDGLVELVNTAGLTGRATILDYSADHLTLQIAEANVAEVVGDVVVLRLDSVEIRSPHRGLTMTLPVCGSPG
jgi:hypothetical protein